MNTTLAHLRRLAGTAPAAPDGALVEAFLAGDQAAFALLVRRHAGLVFATCRGVLRHQQDAEDAFQATFLVLARRAADVRPRAAVGAWLFGVAHRVALKARALRARRAVREEPLEDVPAAESPAREPDTAELVRRAVAELPDVYRAAVTTCDIQGLSRKNAAERLGWSEGTLSGRLARARSLLASRLKRKGLCLPAGGAGTLLLAPDPVPAALIRSTCGLATEGTVPFPVAALTEGAVRGMTLFKFKAMAAVVAAACALGFGAFGASGAHGSGDPVAQKKPEPASGREPLAAPPSRPAPQPTPGPRVGLAEQELQVLRQELGALKGKIDPGTMERLIARLDAASRLLDPTDRALTRERPAKPGSDLDPLQGSWRIVSVSEAGKSTLTDRDEPWVIEISGGTLKMPYKEATGGWKTRAYAIAVEFAVQKPDAIAHRNTLDLIAPNEPVGRGIYEFTAARSSCVTCHAKSGVRNTFIEEVRGRLSPAGLCAPGLKAADYGLRLALSLDGKRPAQFGGTGVIVFQLERLGGSAPVGALQDGAGDLTKARGAVELARHDHQVAQRQVEMAQAQVEQAQAQLALANQRLKLTQAQFEEAERAGTKAPGKGGPEFTVHVRSLTAPEKVTRLPATGTDTVLDALGHVIDVPIKPDRVSVWVVRDDTLLPVDLGALARGGEAKTNHTLKAGDRLFVQEKELPRKDEPGAAHEK